MLYLGFTTHLYLLCRWASLPNPDANPPKSEIGLLELFEEIRLTVDQEAQIVKAVFPNPPVVMQVFLQRVFAQSVILCFPAICYRRSYSWHSIDPTIHGTTPEQRFRHL